MKGCPKNCYFPGIKFILFTFYLCFVNQIVYSQIENDSLSTDILKQLSLEELMNIEITIVSKQSRSWFETPAAVYVISGEEIKRSGMKTVPEILRLAPNLQVAQVNSHDWAITSRGFNGAPLSNNSLANKLLVMIDGRSVYTPLFGGVFWDVQNVLIEDIDHIEVVSGPGGTLWGANAVNGIINIVTKNTKDSQGLYVSGAVGSFMKDFGAVRYGGSIGTDFHYRVYSQRFDFENTKLSDESDFQDAWDMTQSGFRMDYYLSDVNTYTLQGDFYGGNEGTLYTNIIDGQNVLGRWTHTFSKESDFSLQAYIDRTWRKLPASTFSEDLRTYDFDFQYHFLIGGLHNIVWGIGYRFMQDIVNDNPQIFSPSDRDMKLFSGFVQDEIVLVPNHLKLTVGTKFERNDFSGFELQPGIRIAWTPNERQTIWSAISRAVHSPSRFDVDLIISGIHIGKKDFDSEKMISYELGYRILPTEVLSLSATAFYNQYDDIRTINLTSQQGLVFANDQEAKTWGFEVSLNYKVADWWRLHTGYTYLDKDFKTLSIEVAPGSDIFEGIDPHNQFMFQSIMNLPENFQLDLVGHYADLLPASMITSTASTPAYFTFDARLGWQFRNWELSLIGQNLWENLHPEFGLLQIPRSVYGKISFSL